MSIPRLFSGHWQLIVLSVSVLVLWQTPLGLPLKILIVFFHELSHGLAALATGGRIESISVDMLQGGATVTRGGLRFITLSAGYLGSLVLGAGLFLGALHTRLDRALMALLGAVLIVIAGLYVRDGFALAFSLGTGVAMLAASRFLPGPANDLALRVIGLTSMIYVPWDIFSDTIARAHLRSDARMMAEEFGGATMLWGGLWLAISLAVIWLSLRAIGDDSNIALGRHRSGL